jgi:hypothetical protein
MTNHIMAEWMRRVAPGADDTAGRVRNAFAMAYSMNIHGAEIWPTSPNEDTCSGTFGT